MMGLLRVAFQASFYIQTPSDLVRGCSMGPGFLGVCSFPPPLFGLTRAHGFEGPRAVRKTPPPPLPVSDQSAAEPNQTRLATHRCAENVYVLAGVSTLSDLFPVASRPVPPPVQQTPTPVGQEGEELPHVVVPWA